MTATCLDLRRQRCSSRRRRRRRRRPRCPGPPAGRSGGTAPCWSGLRMTSGACLVRLNTLWEHLLLSLSQPTMCCLGQHPARMAGEWLQVCGLETHPPVQCSVFSSSSSALPACSMPAEISSSCLHAISPLQTVRCAATEYTLPVPYTQLCSVSSKHEHTQGESSQETSCRREQCCHEVALQHEAIPGAQDICGRPRK